MNTLATKPPPPTLDPATVQEVLLGGDLSKLSPKERVGFYNRVCESLGLNPLTQPFAYLRLSGKEILYAKKDATDQLRFRHGVSITSMTSAVLDGVYVVTATATLPGGRTDVSTGAVPIAGLRGEALANAYMKCETKSKRRVTLSICGLGLLDETEVETLTPDPSPLVVETAPERPPAPEGCVYLEQIEIKRARSGASWAEVTTSTGELVLAEQELVPLLEQLAEEQVPVRLTCEVAKNGGLKIVEAQRWRREVGE
jgi:hypothetical protein